MALAICGHIFLKRTFFVTRRWQLLLFAVKGF